MSAYRKDTSSKPLAVKFCENVGKPVQPTCRTRSRLKPTNEALDLQIDPSLVRRVTQDRSQSALRSRSPLLGDDESKSNSSPECGTEQPSSLSIDPCLEDSLSKISHSGDENEHVGKIYPHAFEGRNGEVQETISECVRRYSRAHFFIERSERTSDSLESDKLIHAPDVSSPSSSEHK